jgi:hypothetical protein
MNEVRWNLPLAISLRGHNRRGVSGGHFFAFGG